MKKKILILAAIAALLALGYVYYCLTGSDNYEPAADEIAMHIKLDTKEDIGLLVFDYSADGIEYSGGTSNADGSLIAHDSDNIVVWNKQELGSSADTVEMTMQLRIITEYVRPNYENIYPDEITEYTDPVSWQARFGESYYLTVTGDKANGYKVEFNGKA